VEKLLSATEIAALLKAENRAIATAVQARLGEKQKTQAGRLEVGNLYRFFLDFVNDNGAFNSYPDEDIDIITKLLRQRNFAEWTLRKARGVAALEALNVRKQQKGPPKASEPAPPLAKVVSNADAAANQRIRKPVGKKRQVNTAAINIIGNISIPKDIYNLLALGAEFAWAAAQKAEAGGFEIINNYFNLPQKYLSLCYEIGLTADIYNQVHNLFTYISARTKILSPAQLWAEFWSDPARIQPAHLTNVLSNYKVNCYKRLDQFMTSRRLIAKMADKNAGLTIMSMNYYWNAVNTHLKDNPEVYEKVDNPPKFIINKLRGICRFGKADVDNYFKEDRDRIVPPQFYVMPKLHKAPIGFRPIIPSHSWYTTMAAKKLHKELWPLIKNYTWVVTDRLQLIQQLECSTVNRVGNQLATLDVTALYTSINLATGIERVRQILIKNRWDTNKIGFTLKMLEWVLTNNYFLVGKQWYRQLQGAAMGGNASGTFADLVLASMEEELFEKIGNTTLLYHRYRDDILIVVSKQAEATRLESYLNSMGSLKFNIEQMGKKVHYLDLTIEIGLKHINPTTLQINPYRKPIATKAITHYATYKPEATKCNWITGENIRILRGSHSKRKYNQEINNLRKRLRTAGYPPEIIRSKIKYDFNSRNWLLQKTDKEEGAWYRMETTKQSHEAWNFIQDNFKPLLKSHDVHTTSAQGRTTMDFLNKSAKTNIMRQCTMEEQRAIFTQRNRRRRRQSQHQNRESQPPPTNTDINSEQGIPVPNPNLAITKLAIPLESASAPTRREDTLGVAEHLSF
jgi:hypothetical protein